MRHSRQLFARLLSFGRTVSASSNIGRAWPNLPSPAAPSLFQETRCVEGSVFGQRCSQIPCFNFTSGQAAFKQQPPASEVPLDPEHVNIGNENDKELIRATDKGTSEALFEVVKLHGEDFTETNVATVFNELAKVAANKGAEEKASIHDNPTFQTLIDMVVMGRRRYNVKHLAQILRSLAQLDYDNDMVYDRMSQHIMDKLPKADGRTLADLATGFAEMGHSPSIVLFEAIQREADAKKADLSSEHRAAIEKAFNKLGYKDLSAKVK